MIFEEKITYDMVMTMDILAVVVYYRMELCTPIYLNHDYGHVGVVDIWWWMHILKWRYACQYFWVRLANNVGHKSFLKKKSELSWTHPLTKLNPNKSCYVEKYLALVGMCMSLRNLSIFIQLRSISKSRFSKINTNSNITPPNNLDMITFEILLA
jgi:hypothetical protein